MSKIIIHNKANLSEMEILEYLQEVFYSLSEKPNLSYFEFMSGVKVQFIQQKTCKTFYIYEGNNKEDSN